MAGKNNRFGSQPTTTDPYRTPGTKEIFQTDPQKPLIGSLSRVVEHPHKPIYISAEARLILQTVSYDISYNKEIVCL